MMKAVAAQINKAMKQIRATTVRPGRTWWLKSIAVKRIC